MYTSSDDADDGYYDNYISRGRCGTGPINQQDFTIQDAVNIGLRPKHKSKGHCWICPLGCLYVSFSHPHLNFIQQDLLSFANKGTHPIYTKLLVFELSPMKIHAIKSHPLSTSVTEVVEEIIDILETLSLNHLPLEVKLFVKNCDITAHEYNRNLLVGASDSMQGYCGSTYHTILRSLDDYHGPDVEGWRAHQQKTEPDDNYISRALCTTGPVNQHDFTIHDAVNIGLRPNYNSDGMGCWICPLGCLYVPASHPRREEFHEALLTIANKGSHPIYVNLPFFELSPKKIHAIISMYQEEKLNSDYIMDILHYISLNHLPHEVESFVRNCDNTRRTYHQYTLLGSSDGLMDSSVMDGLMDSSENSATNLNNLDFFLELSETTDEVIYNEYDPLEPEPAVDEDSISSSLYRHIKSRLQKESQKAVKDWEDCNDYDSDSSDASVQHEHFHHESRKRKSPPLLHSDNPPLHPRDQQHADHHHDLHANELQQLLDQLTAKDDYDLSDPSQRWLESMLRKGLNAYAEDNDYDPFSVFDHPQQSNKLKASPITYDDDDPFVASPRTQQHANHHHTTCRPRRPPKFISCPNGILFRVLSHNDSKKILDTSRTDLENILLSQGQFCSRRMLQMSTVFTHDAREQALLQGPKALEFVKTLHRLYCRLSGVLNPPSHTATPEVWIENRYTYKQQEDFLCFDCDFDNNDDDDDDIPTTAAADLLLSLINQVPATPSPPPPLSKFNFSYIDVTPPRTTPSPYDDLVKVPSKPISCDKYSTATLSTTSLERTTSYSLLSPHLLVPSQFIKLSYGDKQYCTVLTSKQRPVTQSAIIIHHSLNHKIDDEMRRGTDGINRADYFLFSPPYTLTNLESSTIQDKELWLEEVRLARLVYVEPDDDVTSIPNPITETFIPSLRAAPSRSVSPDEASNHPYSFSSSVEVGVMIIMIMLILPTILTTILTILPMMLLLLPTVILTHEEPAISPNTHTTITTTVSKTIPSDATPAATFSHDSGKRKELRLQRQQFWAFIQKLHYSRIGSSCSGFQWITAILYKLSMTIWTLWQFHNDGVSSSSSVWQLLLGVLH